MARSSKVEPTESGATGEPQRRAKRLTARSGATRLGAQTTRAAPRTGARATRARVKPAPEVAREAVHAKADAPEAIEAAELRLPEVMRMPDVEPLSPAPLMATSAEALAGDGAPEPTPDPAPSEAVEIEAAIVATTVAGTTGAATTGADTQPARVAIPNAMRKVDRLRSVAVACWQDHVERTMAAGQAIMACGSPQAAVRLQTTYLQSSLASAIVHAGDLARLSTEIARDMLPLRRP